MGLELESYILVFLNANTSVQSCTENAHCEWVYLDLFLTNIWLIGHDLSIYLKQYKSNAPSAPNLVITSKVSQLTRTYWE